MWTKLKALWSLELTFSFLFLSIHLGMETTNPMQPSMWAVSIVFLCTHTVLREIRKQNKPTDNQPV